MDGGIAVDRMLERELARLDIADADDTGRSSTVGAAAATALWRSLEPYHALVYFAHEHRRECDRVGLRGGWMAYFASRAAPLGPVGASVVTALFYNFHPQMVARAIPDAWRFADPSDVLSARYAGIDVALRRILGGAVSSAPVRRAADLARQACAGAQIEGRPMFAANAALDWPDEPHLALWHAATLLREHRGDGHIAALMALQVDGCQAHVLQVAAGVVPRETLQTNRGWSDTEWDAATHAFVERGWVTGDGGLTAAGRHVRDDVADLTDRLAAGPVVVLGDARMSELLSAMEQVNAYVRAAGDIPFPNPMGVPAP